MSTRHATPGNIDEYIAGFPLAIQAILQKVRATVREAAPGAQEDIKYGMPTLTFHGDRVHFAAWKHHIGFYGRVSGSEEVRKEIARYQGPKGSIRFPLDEPIRYDLISQLVRNRVKASQEETAAKRGYSR